MPVFLIASPNRPAHLTDTSHPKPPSNAASNLIASRYLLRVADSNELVGACTASPRCRGYHSIASQEFYLRLEHQRCFRTPQPLTSINAPIVDCLFTSLCQSDDAFVESSQTKLFSISPILTRVKSYKLTACHAPPFVMHKMHVPKTVLSQLDLRKLFRVVRYCHGPTSLPIMFWLPLKRPRYDSSDQLRVATNMPILISTYW